MATVKYGVILVREGLGEYGFKSIESILGWVAVLTFFSLPCFAPDSMNCLNWVLTDTLFIGASCSMLAVVASSSSSSFASSDKMSL